MSTTSPTTQTQAWGNISDLVGQKSSPPPTSKANDEVGKDVFLKLMVAQLQHQNPLEPADGIAFVTQLAQFNQLEQSMGMRENLEAIREVLTAGASAGTTQP